MLAKQKNTTPSDWLSDLRAEWQEITKLPWYFFPWEDTLVQESLLRSGVEVRHFSPLLPGDEEIIANAILCRSAIQSAMVIVEYVSDGVKLFKSCGPERAARNHKILALMARRPEAFK